MSIPPTRFVFADGHTEHRLLLSFPDTVVLDVPGSDTMFRSHRFTRRDFQRDGVSCEYEYVEGE